MRTDSLQQAVYDRLTGDTALMALVDGVYAPATPAQQTALGAYLSIGGFVCSPFSGFGFSGISALAQIDSWVSSGSFKTCGEIQDAVYTSLHRQSLLAGGVSVINCEFESSPGSFLDQDGTTVHGVQMFRILYTVA